MAERSEAKLRIKSCRIFIVLNFEALLASFSKN